MLELTYLRTNRDEAVERLSKRGIDAAALVDEALRLDGERRSVQNDHDARLAELNTISREIGTLMKAGQREEAEAAKSRTTELKEAIQVLKDRLTSAEKALHDHLSDLPNAPLPEVPAGRSADDNVVVMEHGDKPELPEGAQPHWELGERYDLIHMDLGVKLTGAGFPVYTGAGAKLQRALIAFFLDRA
ncbi:MAG: serine--tRNA ligase, partial [Flavobacteriales bacterium]|nr:serine--tRNA ligase [Flavobacteriales bacterium]